MNFFAWYIIYTLSGLYTCKPSLKTTMHCILYWCDFFFLDVWQLCRKEENYGQQGLSKSKLNFKSNFLV